MNKETEPFEKSHPVVSFCLLVGAVPVFAAARGLSLVLAVGWLISHVGA